MNVISKNTCEVYIKSQIQTGIGFGIRIDLGEEVFINAGFMSKFNIEVDTVRKLVLAPNPSKPSTPWQAIGVSMSDAGGEPVEAPTPRVDEAKLEDRIMAYFDIGYNQAAITAPALAENMGATEAEMQLALSRMHNAGEMAKAQVHCKGGQDKASWVLWSPSADWFSM